MTVTKVEGVEPLYRDPSRAVDERLDDLIGRMTVEEKAAQLGSVWSFQLLDRTGFAPEKTVKLLAHGIGQVTRVSGASSLTSEEAATVANGIQRHLVEETRLGIPAILHEEICSGLMAREAVIFPQAIGLASTWEPALAEEMADAVRAQMRAMGAHQGLSPVLDVCRDPRWGRTEETFGEDPYLVARMGVAFVRGLQGEDLREGVIATAKHFVGYAASDGGMNWAPARIPPRELREVYLHPFEAVVRTAGIKSLMHAYNELDGIPCAANRELLTSILRDQWGFDGCVVADYFAVRQLADYHRLAAGAAEAAAIALTAGLDVELPGTDCYGQPLLDAMQLGLVSEEAFEVAVRRALRLKFELGLFEQPYVDPARVPTASARESHRSLARRIAGKSLVLLKNDGVLPLPPELSSVAVIGPSADESRNLFGDYAYAAHIESLIEMRQSDRNVFAMPFEGNEVVDGPEVLAPTILDALRQRLGARVQFVRGCDVNSTSTDGFAEAVELAAESDLAILVMGDKAGLTDDCTSGESRDRASLDLPGVQEDLVRAVVATGTPVVLVLVAGRPCGSPSIHEQCAAVLLAWLPGEEGAEAIADALLGSLNPGGKLPISFPRTAGQIPLSYAHKISGGRSHWKGDYVDTLAAPLYPFGHGISYTTFALTEIAIRRPAAAWSEAFVVDLTVSNTGERAGEEVVQLYIRDPQASVTRPVLELKAFCRIELQAGQSRTASFEVPVAQLGFYDRTLSYVVESGLIEVFVGTSSTDLIEAGSVTVVPDPSGVGPDKAFDGSVTLS